MDPRPPLHPDDDLPPPFPPNAFDPVAAERVIRIDDTGELAAALPVLVGFRPRESVVLVALGGPDGRRVRLTARVDIPPTQHARQLAGMLAARLAHERPEAAVLAVVSEASDVAALPDAPASEAALQHRELPHRTLVHELLLALDAHEVPLREALLVRAGRWWSYDCPQACCAPGAGTPVPGGTSALAAASVVAGQVVARDREELELRIARTGAAQAAAMGATVDAVGEELAELVLHSGRDVAADRYAEWVDAAVARCGAAGTRLSDHDVARVVWGLRDVRVRDRALGLALDPRAGAAELLWAECTRRAPEPLDAAPATLLAVSAWLRGDGAMARIALDRALDSQPDYVLADLLSRGMDAGLGPRNLRSMVAATQADLGFPLGPPADLDDLVADLMRAVSPDEEVAAAERVRAARAAATPRRGRARRGKRSRSRTRRPRSPE
jgi:Domain of unknown function (DUF4192)